MMRKARDALRKGNGPLQRTKSFTTEVHDKDSQRITLPDGRIIGFSDQGDPRGYPLLYFHGFPSSRLEGLAMDHVARKRNIRFLTLERPGFGISTFQRNRRILDWAEDVHHFAKCLDLRRFAVMGGSGGGPYALACAHRLPRGMVSAVGLLSSGGPYDKGWEDVPAISRITHYMAKYTPWLLSAVATALVGVGKWVCRNGPLRERFENSLLAQQAKSLEEHKDDRSQSEMKSGEQLREEGIQVMTEGFVQGSTAFVEEALLLSTHWGFELEDVEFDPIHIWHGTEDRNAPIIWIRNMAKRMPQARMVDFDGDTHYSMDRHLDTVLEDLVPESERAMWSRWQQ